MTRFVFALLIITFSIGVMTLSHIVLIVSSACALVFSYILLADLWGASVSATKVWRPLTDAGRTLRATLHTQQVQLSLRSAQLDGFLRREEEAAHLARKAISQSHPEPHKMSKLLYDRVLEAMCVRFRAHMSAAVVSTKEGPVVHLYGHRSPRVCNGLRHIFELQLRNPLAPTGLLDEAMALREFGDLSELGVGKSVVHRVVQMDGSLVLLWLGFPLQQEPSPFALRAISEFVNQFGEGLHSKAKLDEFEKKILTLEHVAAKKNELLSHMSHDIRSPLSNVRTTLELLKVENSDNESKLLIDSAIVNCDSLGEIVDELMVYFRHSAGTLAAAPRELDVLELVRSVVNAYSVNALSKNLRLEVFSTAEDPRIYADPLHVRRVLSNLVGNALKYTIQGEVLVSVDDHAAGLISIGVHDTGLGMSEEQLTCLFTPFKRFHPEHADGVGLGLALSKALVELSGGQIGVSSRKGKGSRFRLTFPAYVTSSQTAREEQLECDIGHSLEKRKVLLVDDDPELVDSLARVIQSDHFEVDRAYSVKDAKSISAFGKPDIVILDFRMPEGGAPQLLRFFKLMESHPVCAVLSGDDHAVVSQELCEYQVDKLFRKPVEISELKEWLKNCSAKIGVASLQGEPKAASVRSRARLE